MGKEEEESEEEEEGKKQKGRRLGWRNKSEEQGENEAILLLQPTPGSEKEVGKRTREKRDKKVNTKLYSFDKSMGEVSS